MDVLDQLELAEEERYLLGYSRIAVAPSLAAFMVHKGVTEELGAEGTCSIQAFDGVLPEQLRYEVLRRVRRIVPLLSTKL